MRPLGLDEQDVYILIKKHMELLSRSNCPMCGVCMYEEQNSCSEICFDDYEFDLDQVICADCVTRVAKAVKEEAFLIRKNGG